MSLCIFYVFDVVFSYFGEAFIKLLLDFFSGYYFLSVVLCPLRGTTFLPIILSRMSIFATNRLWPEKTSAPGYVFAGVMSI